MEFNRNHYMLAGVIVLLLGIQFRLVDSYVLNQQVTETLLKMKGSVSMDEPQPTKAAFANFLMKTNVPLPKKVIEPPAWLGWAMMSVGSVLVLHSLAMKPPG